jgi:hypothetical protein
MDMAVGSATRKGVMRPDIRERKDMDKIGLNLTSRPVDNLIYLPNEEVPEIPIDLLTFLEKELPNRFPNVLEDTKEQLIHYQGKLDLIAELRYLHEVQQRPLDFEEGPDSTLHR